MTGSPVDTVVVDAKYEDGREHSNGPTQYEDVAFLAITVDKLHIWIEGTHYVDAGTPDTVEEGDVFYTALPEKQIWRVLDIDDSVPSSESGVTIEIVYSSIGSSGQSKSDVTGIDVLTGDYDMPMGDSGPPTKLEEKALE